MNINSFLLERALKQLDVPESALEQLRLATALSEVNGKGFPKDLFQLNIKMIVRGLLNFGTLQMNRDWVYPYWVHQQLDPKSKSYVARSQNPLLINITHRNWTALGSPTGKYEAIIDERGLATPLPREWSIDIWIEDDGEMFFPSRADSCTQTFDAKAPAVITQFSWRDLKLTLEAFTDSTKKGTDVLFQQASLYNSSPLPRTVTLYVAIRPFNAEGVAPIRTIEFRSPRQVYVNNTVGVIFSKEPNFTELSNAELGDIGSPVRNTNGQLNDQHSVRCKKGLAHAVAAFQVTLDSHESWSIHTSIALGSEVELRKHPVKNSWRVSYQARREKQRQTWEHELAQGSKFEFPRQDVQNLFDTSLVTLLQLHDEEFISPGPFLYHHFWFRDAAPMVTALDCVGFAKRARAVIAAFPKRMTGDGFFKAPDGEWDSNGTVIWAAYRHYQMTRSNLWLKEYYPILSRAARWIIKTKNQPSQDGDVRGLMPQSISAEHLGTVDQYYWDSFWSLSGLRAVTSIARELGKKSEADYFEREADNLQKTITQAIIDGEEKLGSPLIPAGPARGFDEGAIGSISSVYPLELHREGIPYAEATVRAVQDRFVDERGFFHPLIHSGYNPYLTLQIAHSFLLLDNPQTAWEIANSIFKQASQTNTYPEAIHPITGGGAMGDGHHGWAAAEVVLFLRTILIEDRTETLRLLRGAKNLFAEKKSLRVTNAPTRFGTISFSIEFESEIACTFRFSHKYFPAHTPLHIELHLPFKVEKIMPVTPSHLLSKGEREEDAILELSSDVTTIFLQLAG